MKNLNLMAYATDVAAISLRTPAPIARLRGGAVSTDAFALATDSAPPGILLV